MSTGVTQPDNRAAVKVAICITGLEVGGAETFLAELLRYKPADVEVRVFALIDGGPIAARIEALGIRVTGLHMSAGRLAVRPLFNLVAEFRAYRPDVVHTWLYHADLLGGVAAKLARVPHIIWHLHNSDLSPERVRSMTRAVVRVCAILSHWIPDLVLSCSHAAVRSHGALGYSAKRFMVIPNGVDTHRFAPSAEARISVRKEFGLPGESQLIGLVARVDSQKNHRGFFDAVRIFFERGGDANFLLVGRDVTEGHWQLPGWRDETGQPGRIVLAGPRDDAARLMAALDVLASSSLGEAFPLVLIEAMSCGVPAAASDVGDSAIMVGQTGRIVPPDDAGALADAWIDLLALTPGERATLGTHARQRVLENYSIEQISDRVWTLYRQLVSTH